MKIAVISDIHGNMDAFESVLDDIEGQNIETIISLGDNVGYGAEPNQVVEQLIKRNIPSVMGNHELALSNPNYLNWFNPHAKESLIKTAGMLTADAIRFISGLKHSISDFGCRFVHGFPPDMVTAYLFQISRLEIIEVMKKLQEDICFIGHTHELAMLHFDSRNLTKIQFYEGITIVQNKGKHIFNIGSVGQPRDGDRSAKYVVWDTAVKTIELRFVDYDSESAAAKIRKAGLPDIHALKLL
jgi:predicted phosphodiesterase